ncbi:MAG: SH3 domain-containing protein [Treponema sp.]|jgi:hypothetical protein|nr:SH3 domain-containing protein [Treponema sp.]
MVPRFNEKRKTLLRGVVLLPVLLACFTASCSRLLGYGVLLWSVEDPPVPSGTVLPVYIRSNIEQVWVVGTPKEYLAKGSGVDKFEISLSKLELAGSREKARQRAAAFAPYALVYAETLQDGLPIRENPDNSARRVYRLKQGEIVKVLAPAKGTAAVGASGDPLPGEWFEILTEDGNTGYCFSYRLRLFEHSGGPLAAVQGGEGPAEDRDLELVLSKKWSAESYSAMIGAGRINLGELSRHWGFDPGQDTGIARIKVENLDRGFSYTAIRPAGSRTWRFEGTSLQMYLSSDTSLELRFTENGGVLRSFRFAALPSEVDDIIMQETARQKGLFEVLYSQGPSYTSHNYGTLTFAENGRFTWTGYNILVPQVIPASALGGGVVDMGLFLANSLADRYNGAFTLKFDTAGGLISSGSVSSRAEADFMYTLDSQGFRIEYVPPSNRDGITVARRASSPMVIYFYRSENQRAPPFPAETMPPFRVEPETQSGRDRGDWEDFGFPGGEENPPYPGEPRLPDAGADFLPE